MSQIIADFTMSLDGFIAEPNDDIRRLFQWYSSGDTAFSVAGSDMAFKVSQVSAELLRTEWAKIGAIVTGRRDFDVSKAWGGQALMGVPMFIVTHHAPSEWVYENSPFTFVTDGVEGAIAQAREAAGDKVVGVSGSTITQQCLTLGLLDEIHINLVPLLLGGGIHLFKELGVGPIELETIKVVEGTGVTHIWFRVIKEK
jgi:dihydrofolate reductase